MGRPAVAAVLLAAGAGNRMAAGMNKVFLPLGGRTILAWSLGLFESVAGVDEVVLVAASEDSDRCHAVLESGRFEKVGRTVPGGATRHESEYRGLLALAPQIDAGEVGLVVVHDAVRPFATPELVERLLGEAGRSGAAVPGVSPGSDLVSAGPDGVVTGRTAGVWAIQTPQAFNARRILDAHRQAERMGFAGTDTASVIERTGAPVSVLVGSYDNIKITSPDDLVRAELIARGWTGHDRESVLTAQTFGA